MTSWEEQAFDEFEGGRRARGDRTVVPGSGTDALRGIRGDGAFEAPMGSEATFELDYDLG